MEESELKPPIQPTVDGIYPKDAADNARPEAQSNAQFPANIKPPQKHQAESYYTKPDPTPLWKILLEVIVGAAVIVYTIVASMQLRTMNKSYTEIAKQTPRIAEAAGAATQANIDARDRFRQDERPYL
jgi:hypothetical protein